MRQLSLDAKEDDGPFPWNKKRVRAVASEPTGADQVEAIALSKYLKRLAGEIDPGIQPPKPLQKTTPQKQPRPVQVQSCTAECLTVACISYVVPGSGAVAGKVLQHAVQQVQSLIRSHGPLLFKIGFTHDPTWRWTNSLYGYVHDADGWTDMLIVYVSDEPFGPGMLEASLIDKFKGIFVAII